VALNLLSVLICCWLDLVNFDFVTLLICNDFQVLLNHLRYPVIPKKVTIGKRLAQCLHPALPSGVHLKALEAYDIIFKCIGPQRLAQDLFVYSAGLFPVIAHAAMSVKVSSCFFCHHLFNSF
jgi:hypothetical protein